MTYYRTVLQLPVAQYCFMDTNPLLSARLALLMYGSY